MTSFFRIASPLHSGPEPALQEIEVSSSLQIPSFKVIGLPGPEVAESSERIRAAILASGLEFPKRRVILNLSPSSVRKQGTSSDLAMAIAVLRGGGSRPLLKPEGFGVAWGELGLDGSIKSVGRPLRSLAAAWNAGAQWVVFPACDEEAVARAREEFVHAADESPKITQPEPLWIPASTLKEAWARLQTESLKGQTLKLHPQPHDSSAEQNLSSLENEPPGGHLLPLGAALLRLLSIAAIGRHPLLLWGPKGTGKSHALQWLSALSPPGSRKLQLERRFLSELTGAPGNLHRRIHPRVRPEALLGSIHHGRPRPGELALAHGGLLLADEFAEWSRDAREALREPLESGFIHLSRVDGQLRWPARFQLAATANLCPCGNDSLLSPEVMEEAGKSECTCSVSQRLQYRQRLSGPLMDRLDLVVHLHASPQRLPQISSQKSGKKSVEVQLAEAQLKITAARSLILAEWGVPSSEIRAADLDALTQAIEAPEISARLTLRGRHRLTRVAITLAALEAVETGKMGSRERQGPNQNHWKEASLLRRLPT
jgi:magnesium chelatase family protein